MPPAVGALGGLRRHRPALGLGPRDRLRLQGHAVEQALIAGRRPGTERPFDLDPVHGQARARMLVERPSCRSNSRKLGSDQPAKTITCRCFSSNSPSITAGLSGRDVAHGADIGVLAAVLVAADAQHRQRLAAGPDGVDAKPARDTGPSAGAGAVAQGM